jgi:hypothetical protein
MIALKWSALRQTQPREYLMRFIFGGLATVLAGLIAAHYGPRPGGLFLAFPAIFPASITLIEAHEKKRMAAIGHDGTNRGRMAASIDAAGACLGCVGLVVFAVVLRSLLRSPTPWLSLPVALGAWAVVSTALWQLRRSWRQKSRGWLRPFPR